MSRGFDVVFPAAGVSGSREGDFGALIEGVAEARAGARAASLDQVLSMLDRLSAKLLDRSCTLHVRYPSYGIPYIGHWCRRRSLEAMLRVCFPDLGVLDGFLASTARRQRALRAFPRGVVVHWLAGNVPTLAFLSLLFGMVTKNVNIVKLPAAGDAFLGDLMEVLFDGEGEGAGAALKAGTLVLRFSRQQAQLARQLSARADVRLAWGDDDSVRAIRGLPAKADVQDLVFPSRSSMMVLARQALRRDDLADLARKAALDISVFEQKACASPHTIFLETEDEALRDEFAELLHQALSKTLRRIPKVPPSPGETAAILNIRSEYQMFHRALCSPGAEFSILLDDELKLGPNVGNRTVFLRKVADLEEVVPLASPRLQSVGIAADSERARELAELLGGRGVQRFCAVGTMTHFEVPWDGCLIPQHLIRWVTLPVA